MVNKVIAKASFLFNRIRNVEMVKVFSFTSIATMIRMLVGLISVKFVSIFVGPGGIAFIGQLNNFSSIMYNVASGGVNSGVTKYIAENRQSEKIIGTYISTAFKITLFCSLLVGICLIGFHGKISVLIMLSAEYGYVFIVLGITISFFALNSLLMSILNGYKQYKKYVSVSIITSILGLVFTVPCVYFGGLKGALVSAVTYQSIVIVATFIMVHKLSWFRKEYFFNKFNISMLKKYLHYAGMSFAAIGIFPLVQLMIRRYVISNISVIEAGWWEAMNRLSGTYLNVITASFSVYYLPRLSELRNEKELRHEIFKSLKVIVAFLTLCLTLVYICRFLIIRIVFTEEFLPMEKLFIWQLSGDMLKMVSWLLGYLMVARAMSKTFIVTEITCSGSFLGLAYFFIKKNGVVGITQAYFFNYCIYLVILIVIFRQILFMPKGDYDGI